MMLQHTAIAITCILVITIGSGTAKEVAGTELVSKLTIFESSTSTLDTTSGLVVDSDLHLPLGFLVAKLGIVTKRLQENRIGLCLQELCIPFSIGSRRHDIRSFASQYFVPIEHFVAALNGQSVWLPEEKALLLDFEANLSPSETLSPAKVDFTLPDMKGKPVRLFDFKGRKVIVFAWASW